LIERSLNLGSLAYSLAFIPFLPAIADSWATFNSSIYRLKPSSPLGGITWASPA